MNTNAQNAAAGAKTPVAPVGAGAVASEPVEFGRVQDIERFFGIKRGLCYQLIRDGKIGSVCLRRKPDAKTGIRLINLRSVREFLARQTEGGAS
ncbi:MAG: hypothetical protein HZC54_10695 [Verrucomicrobia bacterium]|nr:hypothetical protein [Verrucomicrobiota bacterium]